MITILTSFKPFVGDDELRQRRSLESWVMSFPDCEIMAFGQPAMDPGLLKEYSIQQVIGVEAERLPKVDFIFNYANENARYEQLLYVNGDMILGSDMAEALSVAAGGNRLVTGVRWDYDGHELRALRSSEDVKAVQALARESGVMHSPLAMDYFGCHRGGLTDLPPLSVGAAGWDNYMIAHALASRFKVVDVSPSVTAVHQIHDYAYAAGGRKEVYEGDLALANRERAHALLPGHVCTVHDATHYLQDKQLNAARSGVYLEQRVDRWQIAHPGKAGKFVPWFLLFAYCRVPLYAGVGRK